MLERLLSRYEHILLVQESGVTFSAPTLGAALLVLNLRYAYEAVFGSDAGAGRVNFSFEWMVLTVHLAAFPPHSVSRTVGKRFLEYLQ